MEGSIRGAPLQRTDGRSKREAILWLNSLNLEQIENGVLVGMDVIVCCERSEIICAIRMSRVRAVYKRFRTRVMSEEDRNQRVWRKILSSFKLFLEDSLRRRIQEVSNLTSSFVGKKELYELWVETGNVNVEMFADIYGETGVCKNVCSPYVEDVKLGSLPKWNEDVDISIPAAGATPHPNCEHILDVVHTFEKNVCRRIPYCRMALLPLNGRQSLNNIVQAGMFGVLVMELKDFYGHPEVGRSSGEEMKRVDVGMFIWCNHQHIAENPPPKNVEELFCNWMHKFDPHLSQSLVHLDAFERAFPSSCRRVSR